MRYQFGRFRLDPQRRELSDGDRAVPIARKAFAVLLHLLENRNVMVSKDELLERFWPPAITESVLQSTIHQIRRAIGDDGRGQRMIRTYHGQGFRFVAPVTLDDARPSDPLRFGEPETGLRSPTRRAGAARSFEERRLATVLACRLASSSQAGPSSPPRADPIASFLRQATRLTEVHGGLVLHVMPDGFTAVFGAALGLDKGTGRAVGCASELAVSASARALQEAGAGPLFGIDAGRFPVVADRSEASVQTLDVPVLRSALALAGSAAPGQAALSARAASHLAPAIRRSMNGQGHLPLARVAVASVGEIVSPDHGSRTFVGRRAEMHFLLDRLVRIRHGRGEATMLIGEAGIGKSRLLEEFLKLAAIENYSVLKLLSDPREANTPLMVMAALCRKIEAARPLADDGPADPVDRALWHDLLGTADPELAPLAAVTPHVRRQRIFRLVCEAVARFASSGPAVIAIEDIHWIDATSRDCLNALAQNLEGLPVLLVLTARPVPEARSGDAPAATSLWLRPLTHDHGLQLIASRIGAEAIDEADAEAIVRRAGGNPFFLEELLVAVEAGADPRQGLPDTIEEVIGVRIGRLSPQARTLLLATAVIGPQASSDLMARVVGLDLPDFEAALFELMAAGVLVEDQLIDPGDVRFRHILLQEAAYAMLAPEHRIELHRHIAEILRGLDRPAPHERLAWHYQEAGDRVRAIQHWTLAARSAQQRSASREAIAFARSGLDLLRNDRADHDELRRELELQLTLAPALAAALGYGSDEVGAAYRRARDLSRSTSTPRSEFRMLVGLWNYDWVRGDLAQAHRHARDLLALAAREANPTLLLRARACMGEILFHLGEFTAAMAQLQAACALFAQSDQVRDATRVPAVACHCYAAWTASFLGRSADALGFCDRAGVIAQELVQPFSMSLYLSLKAELLLFEGDVQGCLDTARAACDICVREGFPFWHGTALVNLGWAEAHAGDVGRGLASLREGIAVFEATGARVQLANWYGLLAEVLRLDGDAAAARVAADVAANWAHRTGDVFFLPRIQRTRDALARTS
jgi:DNA-binding winged helix-turn-helix (wHTH) protein/tetratricopeptide (TPR) repeat protein